MFSVAIFSNLLLFLLFCFRYPVEDKIDRSRRLILGNGVYKKALSVGSNRIIVSFDEILNTDFKQRLRNTGLERPIRLDFSSPKFVVAADEEQLFPIPSPSRLNTTVG